MLISEKQKSVSWQVKTKEGAYFQPDSLGKFYMWIFENRVCADDLVFSVRNNDWIPLADMQEVKYCFWRLLANDNTVYGPLSAGELKQLYLNSQITSDDKVAICGRDGWKQIKTLSVLNNWIADRDAVIADYIHFVENLFNEFSTGKAAQKEDKLSEKTSAQKKDDEEQKKYIRQLESIKEKLEKELLDKERELERIAAEETEFKSRSDSIQKSVDAVRDELREKSTLVEDLNKHIAQAEVAETLKDDEIKQLSATARFLQEKLGRVTEENNKIQESAPEAIRVLKEQIENISGENSALRQDLEKCRGEINDRQNEIDGLKGLVAEKDGFIDEKKAGIEKLEQILQEKNPEMSRLQDMVSTKDAEVSGYKESVARQQGELAEKDRELADYRNLKAYSEGMENEISACKDRIELLNNELTEKSAVIKQAENEISELKSGLNNLYLEHETKVKELQGEADEKSRSWQEALGYERENWEKNRRELENNLVQKNTEIEKRMVELDMLNEAFAVQGKQWQERVREVKDELGCVSEEKDKQKEELRLEFAQKILNLTSERDTLLTNYGEIEESHKQIVLQKEILQRELSDKDAANELLKENLRRQDEIYQEKIRELTQDVNRSNHNAELLRTHIEELEGKIKNCLEVEDGLRKDISSINDELNGARSAAEELKNEKDSLSMRLEAVKEDFEQAKTAMELELDNAKRNLINAEEENKSIQKQFYLEKQKLTKEYNETIGKQEKLYKRGQLEREIQDRTKMKEELERLHNLLKESFEGIERGAVEIESAVKNVSDDIDDKRLSLKYIIETEKREEKKITGVKTERPEGQDTPT